LFRKEVGISKGILNGKAYLCKQKSALDSKIKVAAVSYLNTKPLLYGIEKADFRNQVDLMLEYPSLIAQHLQKGTIDVGLVPVAAIPDIPHAHIISDYGIAADGKVASVSLFSRRPIEEITSVYLDYQSRTSVRLAQTLLKHYWKKEPEYIPAPENYIDLIEGRTGGVIIGDRALTNTPHFPYVYDLSEYWKLHTGLPFIFAAWVANKTLPQAFMSSFNAANGEGMNHLDEIIAANPFPAYDLNVYYRQNIHFKLDETKKKGLDLFLQYLAQDDFE
jgi:chorismate dehydratase